MNSTILWHDFETWGTNPQQDFPSQFAAIRTDLDFNIIGSPINLFCQIPNDYLPHPEACLVTGITPQQSISKGFIETEFAEKIYAEMSKPNTCVVGYNSMQFDEEVTRHLFYRNFLPVYDREYCHGNSRWDIIDLVRATHALRPEGIEWEYYEDGKPCFKLDRLTVANNIAHEDAHDALSDVHATIAMAKLIKTKQPKLFDFYFSLRNKHAVLEQINLGQSQPFLHVSGFIPSAQGCCTWMFPVMQHPKNKNSIICIDLSKPLDFLDEPVEDTAQRMYDRQEHQTRPSITSISVNKSPFVAPAKLLTPDIAKNLGLDRELCLENYQRLKNVVGLAQKVSDILSLQPARNEPQNVDAALYYRDFPTPADIQWCRDVRNAQVENLNVYYDKTQDPWYKKQLFLYQGRNYPTSFDMQQQMKWQQYRQDRLVHGSAGLSISTFAEKLDLLSMEHQQNQRKMAILNALEGYARNL